MKTTLFKNILVNPIRNICKPLTGGRIAALFLMCLSSATGVLGADEKAKPKDAAMKTAPSETQSVATEKEADDPVFAEFSAWAARYEKAETAAKPALETEGVALAMRRREVLAKLIFLNPERALQLAVSPAVRRAMPVDVVAQLEEAISGRGSFDVLIFDYFGKDGGVTSRIQRSITLKGKAFHARVYGRRLGVTTKKLIAVHGIAIDRYMAVDPRPVRSLEAGETLDAAAIIGNPNKICPVCDKDAAKGVIGDVGGVFFYFDSAADLDLFTKQIEAQEDIIDPNANGLNTEKPLKVPQKR